MEIKATNQIQKTQQTSSASQTAVATKTADGKSFVDEISMLPDLDLPKATENKAEVKNTQANAEQHTANENSKSNQFEYVSTTQNNFNSTLNKNLNSKETLHQNAEHELEKEIVLMNNKTTDLAPKYEKTSSQIQTSNFVKTEDEKKFEKDNSLLKSDKDESSELLNVISNIIPKDETSTETTGSVAEKPLDIQIQDQFEAPEPLNKLNSRVEDMILPEKSDVSVKFDAPEPLILADNKIENSISPLKSDISVKPDVLNELNKNDKNVQLAETVPIKSAVQPTKNESNIINKIDLSNNTLEPVIKNATNVENIKVAEEFMAIQPNNITAQTENPNIISNVVNTISNLTEKSEKTTIFDKMTKIDKIKKDSPIQSTIAQEVEDVVEIAPIDKTMKPADMQEMKVLTVEPIQSLFDTDKTLSSNKTSDIVKFIDASLSSPTDTAKTAKGKATGAASSVKKSSDETKTTIKMTETDANFFNKLIENNEQVMQGSKSADNTNIKEIEEAQASQVSKDLLNALKESQEKNKPFRIDFDKDLSVILKVNKDGQVSAEFLPGDKAVEQYLKSNIPLLKQKFNDENLEYENLSYRQSKKENQEEKRNSNNRKNKENGYE